MKPIRLILMILICLGFFKVSGQYNNELYQYNYFYLNPAFAGADGQKFAMMVKGATFGQNNSISNVFLSYETKFDKINSGLGFISKAIRNGPLNETSLGISFSNKIMVAKSSSLTFGIRLENQRESVNYDYYRSLDPNDPLLNPKESESISNFSTDFGVLFQTHDFYLGISTINLLKSDKLLLFDKKSQTLYNLIVGYTFKIGTWGKSMHSIYSPFTSSKWSGVDLNNILVINEKVIAGLTLELTESDFYPKINAGYKLNDSFQVIAMIYSKRREDLGSNLKFNGSLGVNIYFK
jgi:type IX secretion system PorP/SprF family membrane protein